MPEPTAPTPEIWKPVVGFPPFEVSTHGRIYSHRSNRILRGTVAAVGYRTVSCGYGDTRYVHALVGEAFIGPRPEGYVMRHLDGDRLNNRVENLLWGTPRENALDTLDHGHHELVNRVACPREHLLVLPNLVACEWRGGHRECLACARARALVHQARKFNRRVPDFESLAHEKYLAIMGESAA